MKITAQTLIQDAVQMHPRAGEVFMKHGMHCVGCLIARQESIAGGAAAHGSNLEALLEDLNKLFESESN